jgi:hypothetical protein
MKICLDSRRSAAAVLDAIREDTREWRESVVPAPLRSDGVLQVEGVIDGARFQLRYASRYQDRPNVVLSGMVRPLPGGGSRITAAIERRSPVFAFPVLLALLGLWEWYRDGTVGVLAAAVIAFAVAAAYNAILSARDTRGAAYLADRLRQAVDRASGVESNAPVS